MTEHPYSYSILKYRPDAVAGEVLNVGVVAFSPSLGQAGLLYDPRYRRLSQAFARFDGDSCRRLMGRLEAAVRNIAKPMTANLFAVEERGRFRDVTSLIRAIWPDQGLVLFADSAGGGVTSDLDQDLKELFDRFVLSQADDRDSRERFDDQQLWDSFKRVLTPRGIAEKLQPVSLGPAEVEFEHAFKNERWHVIEPLSLDYVDGAGMKRRAYEVVGKVASVQALEEMGTFYVLLGSPKRTEAGRQYLQARRIIEESPGTVEIVEESEVESFAARLELEMRAHGVI
ncbi:MAG: DUF3037 domain-containing protein [Fimbriimonadaceae bacterium]|nr:DUF3037 domain-containing protein [Fimbriimonadaceae bacterium]